MEPSPLQLIVADPLSALTRKERTYLLGVSLVSIVVASTGLVPSEITNFGIKFSAAEKRAFLVVLVAVTAYYLITFVVYAFADYITWENTLGRTAGDSARDFVDSAAAYERRAARGIVADETASETMARVYAQIVPRLPRMGLSANAVGAIRLGLEFVLPIAVAISAITTVLWALFRVPA